MRTVTKKNVYGGGCWGCKTKSVYWWRILKNCVTKSVCGGGLRRAMYQRVCVVNGYKGLCDKECVWLGLC